MTAAFEQIDGKKIRPSGDAVAMVVWQVCQRAAF
jgi:hypothetical protein